MRAGSGSLAFNKCTASQQSEVHEMSHFNVVAGADDWVYGQAGAASLAISDPAKAIDNADSHEYFGENTPALQ